MKTLRWMMDNIYIRTDPAGNIKAGKEKSTEKKSTELLPLMGVEFVRYGMLTVVPFPFKYLREYIVKEDLCD